MYSFGFSKFMFLLLIKQNLLVPSSGGNQRELARAKNLKKQQATGKAKKSGEKDGNKGANLVKRQERCKHLMLL